MQTKNFYKMYKEDIQTLIKEYPFQCFHIYKQTDSYMNILHYQSCRVISIFFNKKNPNKIDTIYVTRYTDSFYRSLGSVEVHSIIELKKELSLQE